MAVAHHAAGFGEHGTQFGVGQRDGGDDRRAQYPGPDGTGTGQPGRAPGAEQPTGANDRAQAGKHEGEGANVAA